MAGRDSHVETAYDAVAYPTAIFTQIHPDRIAARARLHGLNPPDPATARVLEVGCGDAMNLLAMAAAAPQASFTGFDLAPTVIARGRARAEAAGLANVKLEARDLLDFAAEENEPFDYIIAHGFYAWVPDAVRAALLPMIGNLLSPDGIAFISYNTLPGGHFRLAVRDLMRHFIPADADPGTKLKTARAVLEQFATPSPDDGPVMAAYRHQAGRTLQQPDGLLYHDELSADYQPQLHSAVAAEAERFGLAYLGDSGLGRIDDGFLPHGASVEGDIQSRIVRLAQERDFLDVRFFRRSLFVRAAAKPQRHFDPVTLLTLFVSSRCVRDDDGWKGDDGGEFTVDDPALTAALNRLSAERPGRLRVAGLQLDDDRLRSLLQLFDLGAIDLHVGDAPFATSPPQWPEVSPLARAMLNEGLEGVCTLDHSILRLADAPMRAFLSALDGSTGPDEMDALARECGFADPVQWRAAVDLAVKNALVTRPVEY